jgi:protein TonB
VFILWIFFNRWLILVHLKNTIMEAKKSNRADLKNKRTMFFEIGMIIAIAIVLAGFQWSTGEKSNLILTNNLSEFLIDDYAPITRPEPPKPPEAPKPTVVEVIEIVDNGDDIPEVDIPDLTENLNTPITIIDMGTEAIDEAEPEIFVRVEEMPVYPGGERALMKDIMSRVVYPELAKENGAKGRVFVQFVVNSKGEVDRVKIVRGVDALLDNEAVRVIKTLTGWTPGMQRGKPVNVSYTVPINFQLN